MRIADCVCRSVACDRLSFVSLRCPSVHLKERLRRRVSLPFFWVIDSEEASAALVSINSTHFSVISDPRSCFGVVWAPRVSSPASLRCAASLCTRGTASIGSDEPRSPMSRTKLIWCAPPLLPISRILPPLLSSSPASTPQRAAHEHGEKKEPKQDKRKYKVSLRSDKLILPLPLLIARQTLR